MKRRVPSPVLFAIALTIAALLPIYVERTMTHVMFADGSGGTIEWGWKRCTLRSYCADYRYMRREQRPALWLGINAGLAFAYASMATLGAMATLGLRRSSTGSMIYVSDVYHRSKTLDPRGVRLQLNQARCFKIVRAAGTTEERGALRTSSTGGCRRIVPAAPV